MVQQVNHTPQKKILSPFPKQRLWGGKIHNYTTYGNEETQVSSVMTKNVTKSESGMKGIVFPYDLQSTIKESQVKNSAQQ